MTSAQRAYQTPVFDVADPLVCHELQLRPALWRVVFNTLQELAQPYSWRQDDPASATVQEVIKEIANATDAAVFGGCMSIGDTKMVARDPHSWELICDGAEYANIDYPLLAAAIHPNYQTDADHFRVPDLLFRSAVGNDNPGGEGGADEHVLTEAELPAHVHSYTKAVIAASVVLGELAGFELGDTTVDDTGSTGGGEPFSLLNPYHYLVPVIIAMYPEAGG